MTNSLTVTLSLSATDTGGSGIDQMRLCYNGAWQPWETYQTTKSISLTGPAGAKTVRVSYKDHAGNISDRLPATPANDTYYDTINYTGP